MSVTDSAQPAGLRVLGRLRISRARDESTSIERQREIVQQWADTHDHNVIGWAVDEEVSGTVDAFAAPELGPWLTDPERIESYDVIASWKLDRLGRSSIQLNKLFGFCRDHDKTLVCVADNIDLSTWVGRLVANVIAGLAEGELEAIRERILSSRRKLRDTGRWTGGRPPYGYKAVPLDGGGKRLDLDDETSARVREAFDRVVTGDSVGSIAEDFTRRGVPSPADVVRLRNGKPTTGAAWRRGTLHEILTSPSLRGYAMHRDEIVRDGLGQPVRKGPELLDADEFDRLQAHLAERSKPSDPTRRTQSPLLGVVCCDAPGCGMNMHHKAQGWTRADGSRAVTRYYVCPDKHGGQVRAEELEQLLEDEFLEHHGDREVTERRFVPAQSHETELADAQTSLDDLTRMYATARSDAMKQRLESQLAALDERVAELETMPVRSARYETIPTGRTYADEWRDRDTEQRRRLLVSSGIRLSVFRYERSSALRWDLRVPSDWSGDLPAEPLQPPETE
ncbi:recombinase family protein [Gordonia tangerina]|uniref:Recombinase family protein n=1 Tax=Gordonia tangerina TaxID=2911060 RepID=A0ABS9DGM8_9ACTN|nr:recombinase family protein [Gordonia tangerina]MCF3938378.1 recombinase family protein [Gordonia tangerina]